MKEIFLGLFFVLFLYTFQVNSQVKVIAHRGYWKVEGSAQNSIASLKKANTIKVYGAETDLWLTSDGIPVINHDATVEINGKKVVVEDNPLSVLKEAKLSNGEKFITVKKYLKAFKTCKDIKLIIEFKTHKNKKHEDELVKKVIDMVYKYKLQERVEYISFSLHCVKQVHKIDSAAKVYYLRGDLSPEELYKIGISGLDYNYGVLYKHPDWVKKAHDLGLKVNVWTVNKPVDIQKMIDLKVDFITTDEPLLVEKMILKK